MPALLQIDSSARLRGSTSRTLTALFAQSWRAAHPGALWEALDVAAHPLPHFQAVAAPEETVSGDGDEATRTAAICDQVRRATCLVVGVPMYTYTIPSTLKAWLDRLTLLKNFRRAGANAPPLGFKRVVFIIARGGSYAPGAPKAGSDFQTPLLAAICATLGLDGDIHFVHVEMTQAAVDPKLTAFQGLHARSRSQAEARLTALARDLPDPLAPAATAAPPWSAAATPVEEPNMATNVPPPPDARQEPGHSREQVRLAPPKPATSQPAPAAEDQADGSPGQAPGPKAQDGRPSPSR